MISDLGINHQPSHFKLPRNASRRHYKRGSADYEAAKNLRLTFNLGLQRLWHKYLKQEEYLSYQAGSTLTFQF